MRSQTGRDLHFKMGSAGRSAQDAQEFIWSGLENLHRTGTAPLGNLSSQWKSFSLYPAWTSLVSMYACVRPYARDLSHLGPPATLLSVGLRAPFEPRPWRPALATLDVCVALSLALSLAPSSSAPGWTPQRDLVHPALWLSVVPVGSAWLCPLCPEPVGLCPTGEDIACAGATLTSQLTFPLGGGSPCCSLASRCVSSPHRAPLWRSSRQAAVRSPEALSLRGPNKPRSPSLFSWGWGFSSTSILVILRWTRCSWWVFLKILI